MILSEAGLIRLGIKPEFKEVLDPNTFYPAPGQGVISIQTRLSDQEIKQKVQSISDPIQSQISEAELLFMKTLNFDCTIPLGLYISKNNINNNNEPDSVTIKAFSTDNEGNNQKTYKVSTSFETINERIIECAEKVRQNK